MKRLIIAAICLSMTVSANSAVAKKPSNTELCKMVTLTAQTIMEGRQYGMPILEQLQNNDNAYKKAKDKPSYNLINSIIMAAYEKPQYSTEEYQKREINNFAANYYIECMKNIR